MHPRACPICFSFLNIHPSLFGWLKCCCGFSKKEIKMISSSELNPHKYPTTREIDDNLSTLLYRINLVRTAYAEPMIVTSGLRSQAQQDGLIAAGKTNAPKSKHLMGEAVDILDKDGKLRAWVKDNIQLMETIGLWMEAFESTPTWVHFQIVAPNSGNRIFVP